MTTILYFLQKKQADSAEYFVCLQGGGSGVVPPLTDVNATENIQCRQSAFRKDVLPVTQTN